MSGKLAKSGAGQVPGDIDLADHSYYCLSSGVLNF
jgi:hypothetical protein